VAGEHERSILRKVIDLRAAGRSLAQISQHRYLVSGLVLLADPTPSGKELAADAATITNTGLARVVRWVLQFTLLPGIVSISNATLVSERRGRYVVKNLNSNPWIVPGGSVSFVIKRSPARTLPLPSKLVFNGASVV
jgi:hypothetical protein